MLSRLFACLFLVLLAAAPARAESPSAAEAAEFQRIIKSQIEAFSADNGAAAYGFAAPNIQQIFGSPEAFMKMVKEGYPQVYRHQRFAFQDSIQDSLGRPGQKVLIIDSQGKSWVALYAMEKQADGTWRIAGCYILPAPDVSA